MLVFHIAVHAAVTKGLPFSINFLTDLFREYQRKTLGLSFFFSALLNTGPAPAQASREKRRVSSHGPANCRSLGRRQAATPHGCCGHSSSRYRRWRYMPSRRTGCRGRRGRKCTRPSRPLALRRWAYTSGSSRRLSRRSRLCSSFAPSSA
jgi:hypothetical protein